MRLTVSVFSAFLFLGPAAAFAGTATPQIVLTVPRQPVLNQPVAISVMVENQANATPVPTGAVVVSFGDGSGPSTIPVTNSLVTAQHTYSATGDYTVTAHYQGDANFASATANQPIHVGGATSAITLNTFGDSVTAGTGNSKPSTAYVSVITATEGWGLRDYAQGGDTLLDQCAVIYGVPTQPAGYSTLLVGQNEASMVGYPGNGGAEFEAALTSCAAWLLLTQDTSHGGSTKVNAQNEIIARGGQWANSDLYSAIGMKSTTAGSSLELPMSGNSIFVNLTATLTTNYTVTLWMDGVEQGTYSPQLSYTGQTATFAPYGIHLSTNGIGPHSVRVVCTAPGTSGCYVDWFGANAAPVTARPQLWLATPYLTNQGIPAFVYQNMADDIQQVATTLANAELAVTLVDVHNYFSGPTDPQCMYDAVHPSDCGHALIAAAFLGVMAVPSGTSTSITGAAPNPVAVGSSITLTATVPRYSGSGLPTGSVGFYFGNQLLTTAPLAASPWNSTANATFTGSTAGLLPGTYPITAMYSGAGADAPSTSAPFNVLVVRIPTATTLAANVTTVNAGQPVTLTASVARRGVSGTASGTVTFSSNGQKFGAAPLNAAGVATFTASSAGLPSGTYPVIATYNGDVDDNGSTAPAISITLQ